MHELNLLVVNVFLMLMHFVPIRLVNWNCCPLLTPVWWHGVVGGRGTERGIAHRQRESCLWGLSAVPPALTARPPAPPGQPSFFTQLANAMPHRSPAAQRSEDERNDNFVKNRTQQPKCIWQRAGALHHGILLKAKRSVGPSARAWRDACGRRASV